MGGGGEGEGGGLRGGVRIEGGKGMEDWGEECKKEEEDARDRELDGKDTTMD